MKQLIAFVIFGLLTQNALGQSKDLDNFISSYAKEQNFQGTILIQKNGNKIYDKSFGAANYQFNVPIKNETKFKVASITKSFTAVLILQLYEQGKIDLNQPIKTYLPAYTGEGAEKVTIHHLLTHTSGIENVEKNETEKFQKPWFDIYQKPYTTEQILTKFCSGKLVSEVGKKFDYNNGEYIILGKIIENIYNKPYEDVLKQQILAPLKMTNSGLFFESKIIDNIANTYSWNDSLKVLENDRPVYIENWYAAGAMYSTTNDLLKFSNALFGFELLKKKTVELMLTPHLSEYAYSFWVREIKINDKKFKTAQRFGRIRGANAVWFRFFDKDLTIIILSNTNRTNLGSFAYTLSEKLVE
jgi:CubicO group peptidase (beta-lactamase class C family)